MTICIIIVIMLLFVIIGFQASEREIAATILASLFLGMFSMLLILETLEGKRYSDGVKDTLNHKNNYKINYQKVNDSTFIPIDTVIIK